MHPSSTRAISARLFEVKTLLAIENKAQNYKLWVSGALGNRLRSWRTHEEYLTSRFGGRVVLRYLGECGGRWCKYNLRRDEVDPTIKGWLREGAELKRVMFNEAAPDQHVTLQGELWNGGDNWNYFHHSFARLHMRAALAAAPERSCGLRTEFLLRSHMTFSSYADLQVLRELYPDHVLEIGVYSVCVGDIPGRNALVWEVRRY